MAVRDAILALTPVLYWDLQDPVGTTAVHDSSGNGHGGAVTGDLSLGVFGPELGSTAARIYATGTIASAAWGWTAWPDFSVMAMLSGPATIPTPSNAPVLGIGDMANPNLRGLTFVNSSSSVGTQQWSPKATLTSVTFPGARPQEGWHLYTLTYRATSPRKTPYTDGTGGTQLTGNLGTAPLAGDTWWINSAWPATVAHFAIFSRELTLAEIQSVSNQIKTWPYDLPINVPISGGSDAPVTISPTDPVTQQILSNTETMLPDTGLLPAINTTVGQIKTTTDQIKSTGDATHTDTQNIVNTLFPQLEGPLNYIQSTVTDILNGITTTITNAAGSVGQTLGDFFSQHSHDQFGVFSVTGGPTCSRIDWTAGIAAYQSAEVKITSWPSEWTFTTPDDGWSIRDLAVLTIWIGSEQQLRAGIHTKSFTVNPLPSVFPVARAAVGVAVTPPNYRITVDWAGGVCGELLLNYLP